MYFVQKSNPKGSNVLGNESHIYIWCIPADQVNEVLGTSLLGQSEEPGEAAYVAFSTGKSQTQPLRISRRLDAVLRLILENTCPRVTIHAPDGLKTVAELVTDSIGQALQEIFPLGFEKGFSARQQIEVPRLRIYSSLEFQYWLLAGFANSPGSSPSACHEVTVISADTVSLDTVEFLQAEDYSVPLARLPLLFSPASIQYSNYKGESYLDLDTSK